jgi:ribosomal protein S18 acetylase RimI-like enzyme
VPDYAVRPLRRGAAGEIELVAQRMRLTLIEVLGPRIGADLYSMDWLRARVRWHLDPAECTGDVLVAESAGAIVGHTIVRLEPVASGETTGLFSTVYVVPEARRRGIANALVQHGEAWLASHHMTTFGTSTSATNTPLIALFTNHGYEIVLRVAESNMVHLSKTLPK